MKIPVKRVGRRPQWSQSHPQIGADINLPSMIDPPKKPTQYPVLLRLSTKPKYMIILLAIGKTTVNIKEFVKIEIYTPKSDMNLFILLLCSHILIIIKFY